MQANVTRPTMPIGISRSVIGSVSALPALRARDAAIAPARPLATGFTNLSNVQTADTPIAPAPTKRTDRKSTRLNSSHSQISYAVFCLKKKKSTYHRNLYVVSAKDVPDGDSDDHDRAAHVHAALGNPTE